MTLHKRSPCKVNLLLNILSRRPDGFHEVETLMHPVGLYDELSFARSSTGIELTCNNPTLPSDSRNLVHRAAAFFLQSADIREGVRMHLEKRIPLAAGLGGGSANAAITLVALNELFGSPLDGQRLYSLAAALGSDVPFFLRDTPALATGRGEQIQPIPFFDSLSGAAFLLVHPGFGIASAWAYQQLQGFPEALHGRPGRAQALADRLRTQDLRAAGPELYNSLEAPALAKFPLLSLFQEFFREQGAPATLMSGSGSTTFAIAESQTLAQKLLESFERKFGSTYWTAIVPCAAASG